MEIYSKQPLSYSEQLDLLASRGLLKLYDNVLYRTR